MLNELIEAVNIEVLSQKVSGKKILGYEEQT